MGDENRTREELLEENSRLRKLLEAAESGQVVGDDRFHTAAGEINFRELLQCLPDIVYNIDSEGRFTYVSDYIRVLGYEPGELLGQHFSVIMHPDDVPAVSRSMVLPRYRGRITGDEKSPGLFDERRSCERITRGMDIRLRPKSAPVAPGGEVHGNVYSNAEVNACGSYLIVDDARVFRGTIGIIRDITTRKKSEMETLRRSEERYRELIQQSRDAIVQVGSEGRIVYSNPAARDIFGLDALSMPYFAEFALSIIHPDYRARFTHFWDYYTAHGAFLEDTGEWAWVHGDGRVVYTEIVFSSIQGDDGQVTGFQTIARDITRRKSVEISLRESEEMFRNLAEYSPNMIFINQKGRVVYANRECERVTGYARQELYADDFSFMRLIPPESEEVVKDNYVRHLRGEDTPPYEYLIITKDGRRLSAINSTKLIKFRGDDALLGLVTDITERKIAEDNIRKAQKLESLGILAGGIAHDFNNILTVIMGNITLCMLNPSDTGLVTGNLKAAEEAVGRAKELTKLFLTFSKTSVPVKRTMHIAGLLQNAVSFAASGSAVKYEFQISEDLWPVEVDEGQINQVVNNLVINAVQAMPHGGMLSIRVSNELVDGAGHLPLSRGNFVKITFKDTGQGIPEENIARIFDPYFSTREMASGLGLAISYSIISKHGGFIDVASKTGEGTVFTVYLPASSEAVHQEYPDTGAVVGGRGRILVMDDDEGVLTIAEKFLAYLGYEFEMARDGSEAVHRYSEAKGSGRPFDVVVLDLTVPGGMSGRDCVARLIEIDPGVRAVLSSGYINDPVVINYLSHGFRDVITKPYRIEELSRVLHRILTG
jgi:PAS domain S-box-containing protein